MGVAVADLDNWSMNPGPTSMNIEVKWHGSWFFTANFCWMRFLNDARCFPGETSHP